VLTSIGFLLVRRKAPYQKFDLPLIDQQSLEDIVPLSRYLPLSLQTKYHQKVAAFLNQIYFKTYHGLTLTHEMKLMIAGHACLLTLNKGDRHFRKLHSVHIMPEAFVQEQGQAHGVSHHNVHGVSFENGKVVLAWNATENGAKNHFDGKNVALHEFSHQFDQEDGNADGVPIDVEPHKMAEWAHFMSDGFKTIKRRSKKKRRQMIDKYGETSPAEFFAVLTETFFEKGIHLKRKYPDLYQLMQDYYGLDTASWNTHHPSNNK
jgi:MtfA peptidase